VAAAAGQRATGHKVRRLAGTAADPGLLGASSSNRMIMQR